MISYFDHLRTLARLMYDADLKRVWPQVKEKAGRPRLLRRFKVLQCERLSGARIKGRYRSPATMPNVIKALNDTDRYISALVLFKNADSRGGFACVDGIFELTGRAIVLSCGEVYAHDSMGALHFRHLFPHSRMPSRQELMADLAERLRTVVAAQKSSLLQRGVAEDSIGLTRTRELLSGLESAAESEDLLLMMHGFIATMLDRENHVLDLEEAGLLPPGTEAEISDLMQRLRFVLS